MTMLGERFDEALDLALGLHREQVRQGTEVPYFSHLLGVASLVLEDGGDEDEAIAGLLHDAVEDGGGQDVLETIRARFGDDVADSVLGCSDTDEVPKPPWRERKERYIAHLLEASGSSVVRVSLVDKLHNVRALVRDVRVHGETVWNRFNPESDQLWYYRTLANAFAELGASPMVDDLEREVDDLETLAIVSALREQGAREPVTGTACR
jgi:GTP pyrophosphokinase